MANLTADPVNSNVRTEIQADVDTIGGPIVLLHDNATSTLGVNGHALV